MEKRDIASSKNLLKFKGNIEKSAKELRFGVKRIIVAAVVLSFIIPIHKQVLADEEIKPGRKQATLILSDGTKIILGASSDTIINSKTTGVHIKIDSCGINYMSADSTKKVVRDTSITVKSMPEKKK